ncbi:TetR/AcrR family transcriptional regulator [Neomegalonema sp.]|uniref:TetR/AcrR family transcriptional regulator n=1 Tax=Neomegalonema sp. TaxID=2039713 RepID=UPI0026206A7C|nr:TetR/AcrR family transcriptional regulator [Neomegalonema sp.]MDD2870001.1 TetR/AcrR family transcriptional regulator [Neomegalonema sp.]
MKVSREKARENRESVIEASSRLFRRSGFDGVGIGALMQAAGLTHGGFYRQFGSKDDLILQATRAALGQTRARLTAPEGEKGGPSLDVILRRYLSEAHRDAVGEGCALAALGPDVARHGPELRAVLQQGVEECLPLLEASVGAEDPERARDKALATLATMVGALVLARAVEDAELSREILDAAIREASPAAKPDP